MKRIIAIIFVLVSVVCFSQTPVNAPVVQRASASNTVQDARLMAQFNLDIPRYEDTTAANVASNIAIDSCGAIIFTYDVNAVWVRACSPKRWERVTGPQVLPDGVFSGGDVAWTGTGLDFTETAAIYVLNGVVYTTPTTGLNLTPSDPVNGRIDLIGLGVNGPEIITGVPSSSPQEPSFNPQTFIRRAAVLVEAGALTPTIITNSIFDEDLGLPDEWTPSVTNGTVDFANTSNPFHLTIAAHATSIDSSSRIKFNYSDTVNSAPRGSIVGWVYLYSVLPSNQNLYIQLYYLGLPVSLQLPFTGYGLFRGIPLQYQPVIFPMPAFGATNIIFDEIRIRPTGGGSFPVIDFDFLQFQSGFSPIVTQRDFAVIDNYAYGPRYFDQANYPFNFNHGKIGINTATVPLHTLTLGNEIDGTPGMYIYSADGQTSYIEAVGAPSSSRGLIFAAKGNISLIPDLGSSAGKILIIPDGNANQNISLSFFDGGSGVPGGKIGTDLLEAGVSNEFYIKPTHSTSGGGPIYLTLYDSIKLRGVKDAPVPDSIVTIRGGVITRTAIASIVSGSTNANIGSGYRWAVPNTSNIKTSFVTNGILADSSSNANGLTFQMDSTTYTTRDRLQKLIDSTTVNYTALFSSFTTISNVGSGYRLVVANTMTIKTLNSGYSLSWDSITSNQLRITIDTTLMATRAWAQSIAGGGGFTGVTSVAGTNANGFALSIATPTSTPNITISTTITGVIKGNGTAISAATVGTDYSVGTSALATGILKSTTATGALSIAVAGTDYVIPSVTTLASLTTAASLVTVGTMTSGSISTGFIIRGVTMTLGSDASFDLYYRNASGILTRLPNGTTGQFLSATTGAAPTWTVPVVTAGVSSITGTANQVIASASTGAVTLSLPQSIAVTSVVQFGRLTLGGTAATSPLTFVTNTDATASAGRWYYNTTRLGFALAGTILRVPLTNDVAPANGQIPIGNGTNYTVAAISPNNNTMVITNGSGSITIGLNMAPQALTDAATITWNSANGFNATVTINAVGRTLTITNPVAGATYTLVVVQGAGGNRTITTWPTGTLWPAGLAPVLSTAAGARNVISFYYNGFNFFGAYTNAAYQ